MALEQQFERYKKICHQNKKSVFREICTKDFYSKQTFCVVRYFSCLIMWNNLTAVKFNFEWYLVFYFKYVEVEGERWNSFIFLTPNVENLRLWKRKIAWGGVLSTVSFGGVGKTWNKWKACPWHLSPAEASTSSCRSNAFFSYLFNTKLSADALEKPV